MFPHGLNITSLKINLLVPLAGYSTGSISIPPINIVWQLKMVVASNGLLAGSFATLAGLSAPTLGDNNASNTVAAVIAPAASTCHKWYSDLSQWRKPNGLFCLG